MISKLKTKVLNIIVIGFIPTTHTIWSNEWS